MKTLFSLLIALLVFLPVRLAFGQLIYEVEPNHSTVGFSVPIAGGITRVSGKFMDFQITISYGRDNIPQSSVTVVIQATSINTGIAGRDDHLRSPVFFDVAKYPTITFTSRRISKRDEKCVAVGDFTMHGVTKEIEFPQDVKEFTHLGQSTRLLAASVRWTINRKAYGVGAGFKHNSIPDFLGDGIAVEIDMWTKSPKK